MIRVAVFFSLLISIGCGGATPQTGALETVDDFECRERRAEYSLVGGFGAAESGVSVGCAGDEAKLESWRMGAGGGDRIQDAHSLSQAEFEELWKKLESTGWRNLGDCDNPDADDSDPIYTIDISNDVAKVSITCQGKGDLPFPYDRLINELDLKAAALSK